MKNTIKYILSLLFILMILSGCGNASDKTEKITEAENSSSVEMKTTVSNEKITEPVTETYTTEIKAEWPPEAFPTKYNSKSWQIAYADYIDEHNLNKDIVSQCNYSLINIDNNDIPELFISTPAEASGEIVVTYYDGNLNTCQLSRIGSRYIEESGLIYSDNGHMWYFPVTIIKLENGEFSVIGSGLDEYSLDENKNPLHKYTWENETVSEEDFNNNIDKIFDRELGIRPKSWYSTEEILSRLRTGSCTSHGHHYELIQEDVSSWSEAQENCKKKGGYLATITSPDEKDTITAQIEVENKTDISFYVGYRSSEWIGEEFVDSRWINPDSSFTDLGCPYDFWKYAAPDYDYKNAEWDRNEQNCGLIKYYDDIKRIYLFEAPERLLDVSPEYSGRVGYICEYDE